MRQRKCSRRPSGFRLRECTPEEATPIVKRIDVAGKPFLYMQAATQLSTIAPSPWTVPTARTRSPPLSDSHEPPNDVPLSVRTVCPWIVKVITRSEGAIRLGLGRHV